MKKCYILPANEAWICDRLVQEFFDGNTDMCVPTPMKSDIVWLFSDWCWSGLAKARLLDNKKVLTTVHHIVFSKFGKNEAQEFAIRDSYTTAYHVFNQRTYDQVREIQETLKLPKKSIHLLPYWCNDEIWFKTLESKIELRAKYKVPEDAYVCFSAQRDTEGSSITSGEYLPKLEKGADKLADFIIAQSAVHPNMHVVLGGWRRQYVIKRLQQAGVPYTYIELPKQEVINDLYNLCDLYPVASRWEGGPQSLIEAALTGTPVVSTPVGIANDVLTHSAVSDNLLQCIPEVPRIPDSWRIPFAFKPYRELLESM